MTYYDRRTGKPVTVYLFVGDLVYSRLAYVEPTLDMRQMSWMSCNIYDSIVIKFGNFICIDVEKKSVF